MLKKFLIERKVPGLGQSSQEELRNMAAKSNEVLHNLGGEIQWNESFITEDKMYCVYLAKDEDIIRKHAKEGGFPVDKVSEITHVTDPSTAGSQVKEPRRSTQEADSRAQSH